MPVGSVSSGTYYKARIQEYQSVVFPLNSIFISLNFCRCRHCLPLMRRKWKWGTRWWKIWRQHFGLSQWGEQISPSTFWPFHLLQAVQSSALCDLFQSFIPTIWLIEAIPHILNPVNNVTCHRKNFFQWSLSLVTAKYPTSNWNNTNLLYF